MLPMTHGHQANDARLAVDGVDDSKPPDTILPQPVQFAQQRLPAFGIGGNSPDCSFDGAFEIRVERPDDLSHMRRDVRTKGLHAVRRFLTGVTGSPNTSSKVSPFLPVR